jgi:molybdopterin converting factor subunit 1
MIKVRFFAMLKGVVGKEEIDLPVHEYISLGKLKDILKNRFPAISESLDKKSIMISVNHELATDKTVIRDGDEVALLPPFSGG